MKKNNKGFTVVELLASFTLTMIIVVFLFEIILELKNIYINESIRTESINKNAGVATTLNKMISREVITGASCSSSSCTISLPSGNKTISISSTSVTVGGQKITYPDNVKLQIIELKTFTTNTGIPANNSYIQIKYNINSDDLDKPITFNYVYTYMS